jgi:predicted Zn-dependent peptidase
VTEDELTKFKRSSIKSALSQLRSNPNMAALLTYADVVLGDYGKAFDQIDEIKALKAEDIKRVANQYLVKNNRTIGEIVSEK